MNLLTDREYLGLTVPFMLSTMTQPLMGGGKYCSKWAAFLTLNILQLVSLGAYFVQQFILVIWFFYV